MIIAAGPLHDVGKLIANSDHRGELKPGEDYKRHMTEGTRILTLTEYERKMLHPTIAHLYDEIFLIAMTHHENFAGYAGYPFGFMAEEIPLGGKLGDALRTVLLISHPQPEGDTPVPEMNREYIQVCRIDCAAAIQIGIGVPVGVPDA